MSSNIKKGKLVLAIGTDNVHAWNRMERDGMGESEQDRLRRCLDEALAAADAAGDTLIAAKLADCLWLLDRAASTSPAATA
jgi:hypothetical protein